MQASDLRHARRQLRIGIGRVWRDAGLRKMRDAGNMRRRPHRQSLWMHAEGLHRE
jgi:hypothetical protein